MRSSALKCQIHDFTLKLYVLKVTLEGKEFHSHQVK